MTLLLKTRPDKARCIQLLADCIHRFIFPGISSEAQAACAEHIAWMNRQTDDLNVTCKLETIPAMQITRMVVEASFKPIKSLADQDKT